LRYEEAIKANNEDNKEIKLKQARYWERFSLTLQISSLILFFIGTIIVSVGGFITLK